MDPILAIAIGYGTFFVLFGLWSFGAMAKDKRAAENQLWRTSECKLHSLEFLGGWFGSLSAQVCFHHKVKKISYQITFWFIVICHITGAVLVFMHRDEIREYFNKE